MLRISKMNSIVRIKCLRNNLITFRLGLSTSPEVIEQNETVLLDETDDNNAKEIEINKKRNISRLVPAHFNLVNGRRPYNEPKSLAHLTVKYNRKLYGKYGINSGVNPSLCWPSKVDLEERREYESVAFPYTIQEMMESAEKQRREQQHKVEQREKEVAAKFAKLEIWKKELNDKLAKKIADAQAAKDKKERLVEEVRRHFGFTLDPRDDRFKEMLAKREKEQKKMEKLARKEAKEKIMLTKLQQKNLEVAESTKPSS